MSKKKVAAISLVSAVTASMLTLGAATSASAASWAEITVDLADRSHGEIYHGVSGSLYGLSEPNVPDINTIIPLKPSHVSQKGPGGIQHPSGDALRVSDYFFEAGGSSVEVVMQDYYARWYYPARTGAQYIEEAIIPQTTDIKAYKDAYLAEHPGADVDEMFVYIPYNEPEQSARYPSLNTNNATGENSRALFYADWKLVYDAIREIDPGAKISGPNLLSYGTNIMNGFVPYCVEHDCLPDVMSWHMLWNKAFNDINWAYSSYRALEQQNVALWESLYPDREVPFPLLTDINEYAPQAEIAVGGHLIQSIARYDELKMKGALPYWNTANSYGSLLAGQNEPNGAWWLYKWYADMEGDMAKVAVVTPRAEGDTLGDGLYGLSTINDEKEQVGIAFGGTTGESHVVFNNVTGNANSPEFLSGAENVHITVWRAGFTGLTGFSLEPQQVVDGNFPVVDGSVVLPVTTEFESAYYAVVTEAVESEPRIDWFERYEAENATQVGTTTAITYPRAGGNTNRSASNASYVQGITSETSKVTFDVEVPADGNYRLDVIEASFSTATLPSQSGGGTSSQRQSSEFYVKIDDQPSYKMYLRPDYSNNQFGMTTQFLDLTAGGHTISFSKYNQDNPAEVGQGSATLDAIELTHTGALGSPQTYRVEAEFSDYDAAAGLQRDGSIAGFTGAGYVSGYDTAAEGAKSRFYTVVQNDGVYDVTFGYSTSSAGTVEIDHDRSPAVSFDADNTDGEWTTTTARMFLRTGINIIDVKSTAGLNLDYLEAVALDNAPIYSIEAEDATIVGTPAAGDPALIREDVFAKYASGGKYVNGITSFDGQERYVDVPITVPAGGSYKLVVHYSNGHYAGSHSYNNNVVERYVQMSVNGGEPETHHFKNTISWQHYATQTFDVDLVAGENTIRYSVDNSYDGGSNPYGGNNGAGTAGFTPVTLVPNQYAPAFDKFEVFETPTLQSAPEGIVVDRVAGATRYDVAVNISQSAYPDTAPVVYVASGENYPDALSAGPAAAYEGGPLLLVRPDEVPEEVATEIDRLEPSKIVVVGGILSVTEGSFNELATMADQIDRIAGANRYEVSRNVVEYAFGDEVPLAYVATGKTFPDALAAGGAAGSKDAPVLLVDGSLTDLDESTATLLEALGTTQTRVLGGEVSVTPGVFNDLDAITEATRLGGANRYEAARTINTDAFETAERAFIATGLNFPDALAGSAWAASAGAPLYVAPGTCVTAGVLSDLDTLRVTHVTLLGGEMSLTPQVYALTPCA